MLLSGCPLCAYLILLLLFARIRVVAAAYILGSPYHEENFNPAEADPRGAIKCVGDRYDGELPADEFFNPNEVSMQKLCAKPQYGGGSPGTHIGGWCSWTTIREAGRRARTVWIKRFDLSYEAHVHDVLAQPRVMLACYYRCYCSYPLAEFEQNPNIQPRADHDTQGNPGLVDQSPANTYEIKVDVVDDFDVPMHQHLGAPSPGDSPHLAKAFPVFALNQIDFTRRDHERHNTSPNVVGPHHNPWISMLPENSITCRGDLPSWPLPMPYQLSDFENIQQLCALSHFGGHTGANAGGYCHRSVGASPDQQARTVWFSDEFTPRRSWTWTPNWRAAGAIRMYCWQRCACTSMPRQQDNQTIGLWMSPIAMIWRVSSKVQLAQQKDGSINVEEIDAGTSGEGQSLGEVLPRQVGAKPQAGHCGHDHKQFCDEAWPIDVLGPVPRSPPDATNVWKDAGEKSGDLTQCGSRCEKPQDCRDGGATGGNGCFCALPSLQDIRKLGLDPVAPVAVCLALMYKVNKGIAGRDVERYVDQEGENYRCLCNATFVAEECCGARDGMVYLD